MRRVSVCVLFLLLLTACGGRQDSADVPTLAPTADLGDSNDDSDNSSPRVTPAPGLPPTWTPAPVEEPATPLPPPTDNNNGNGDSEAETYVVVRGDTLAEIAQALGVSLSDLARVNNIENIDRIEVGQVLIIPR